MGVKELSPTIQHYLYKKHKASPSKKSRRKSVEKSRRKNWGK